MDCLAIACQDCGPRTYCGFADENYFMFRWLCLNKVKSLSCVYAIIGFGRRQAADDCTQRVTVYFSKKRADLL